jgi:hypothetical protein
MLQYVAVMTSPTETVVKLLMPECFVGLQDLVKTKIKAYGMVYEK